MTDPAPDRPRSNTQRIAAILGSFDALNTPQSSAALIARLGFGRSTGFALIRELARAGWLERADHGLVRLGPLARRLMFTPLEPGLDVPDTRTRRIAAPGTVQRRRPVPVSGDDWEPRLAELANTTRFALSRPARIGFANASLSNPWRRALSASMHYARRLFSGRIEELRVLTADDDPGRQLSQIEELVASGIDLLLVSCTDAVNAALSARLAELAQGGLPIVAVDRRPGDAESLVSFVTASNHRIGRVSALWMAERLKGSGCIWMLSGLEGASPAIRRQSAALAVFEQFPGIEIAAISYTGWTEAGGVAAVSELIKAGHTQPDGVWCDSGLQGVGALRRLLRVPGPTPIHTGGDLNEMYKLALREKVPFAALDYPAAMGGRAIEVAVDILGGRPVPRRVEVPVQVVLPRGCETASVSADIWAETHVGWDLADDAVLSQGPSVRVSAATGLAGAGAGHGQ